MVKQLAIVCLNVGLLGWVQIVQSVRVRNDQLLDLDVNASKPGTNSTSSGGDYALGTKGQPLIPALVPPPGHEYRFLLDEKRSIFERNDYKWYQTHDCVLDSKSGGQNCLEKKTRFMTAEGKFWTNALGRQAVNIVDMNGKRVFKIRRNRWRINPFQMRNVFRIFPPHDSDVDQTLFTINRDIFGKGVLWLRDEYRVYIGRKRDGKQLYYAIGGYWSTWSKYKIYKISGSDYKANKDAYVGKISKKKTKAGIVGDVLGAGDWLGDKFKIEVKEGEDSAVLMVLATLIDMFNDNQESDGQKVDAISTGLDIAGAFM